MVVAILLNHVLDFLGVNRGLEAGSRIRIPSRFLLICRLLEFKSFQSWNI